MDGNDWSALGLMLAVVGCLSAATMTFAIRRALARTPRIVVGAILGGYVAVSVVGFVIGFGVAGGPLGRRLTGGSIGVAMGWLLLWFLTVLVGVSRAVWATAHHASRVQPIPPPATERR